MRSSLEDLVARVITVKTECSFDTRFNFLIFLVSELNAYGVVIWVIHVSCLHLSFF